MKTLVIRFSSAGDIILTSLFIRALRKRFPEAEIAYLTKRSFAQLVECSPYVNRVITIEDHTTLGDALSLRKMLRKENYDLVFDLHNSLRSRIVRFQLGKHRAFFKKPTLRKQLLVRFKINQLRPVIPIPERYLAVGAEYGLQNDGEGIDLFIGDAAASVKELLPDGLPEPLIALGPGARHFTKRWPADRFALLGKELLRQYGGTILLLGGPDEVEVCQQVEQEIEGNVLNLAGKTTIPQAGGVIDRCRLLISNDSALAHVAAARKVPVIAIFGSTVEEFGFAPYAKETVIVQNEGLPCRPCTTTGRSECPQGHFRCMEEITIAVINKQVQALM